MTRVLVTGASGLLGRALIDGWRFRFAVIAAARERQPIGGEQWLGDLTGPGAAAEIIAAARPDVVVHAAAWTDVDGCEADPRSAFLINAEASARLAAEANRCGAEFVYISTSAVFDGEQGDYREEETPSPINVYGQSKLAGEQAVMAAHSRALVLRVSLEGFRRTGMPPGFVQWVVEGVRRGDPRNVCTDWRHTLVFADNVPAIIESFLGAQLAGVYHVAGVIGTSNWEIAMAAAEEFALDRELIRPILSSTLNLRARRPADVTLSSAKMREVLGDLVWPLPAALLDLHRRQMIAAG